MWLWVLIAVVVGVRKPKFLHCDLFFSFVYMESECWSWVFKQKNMMVKKKKCESPFTGEKKITGLPGKMWWASSLQLPFPIFYLQKFKRAAKPQVPQNMTVLNYKVKGLILHTVMGSVRRKYYPPWLNTPFSIKIANSKFILGNVKVPRVSASSEVISSTSG